MQINCVGTYRMSSKEILPRRPRPLSSPPILRRFSENVLHNTTYGIRRRQDFKPPPGLPRYPRNFKKTMRYNFRYRMGEEASLLIDERFLCTICCGRFVEPRILPCLHTFCTECIRPLVGDRTKKTSEEQRMSASPPSGYESEGSRPIYSDVTPLRAITSYRVNDSRAGSLLSLSSCSSGRSLTSSIRSNGPNVMCPTCKAVGELPIKGVEGLPLDHVIQKSMVLSDLNHPSTLLLCDLCVPEVTAMSRCDDCLTNLCEFCSQAHSRQRHTAGHTVEALEEARRRGIKKVHRVVMCSEHPQSHVNNFCPSCRITVCDECCNGKHKTHSPRPLPEMARHLLPNLKNLLESTRPETERLNVLLDSLSSSSSGLSLDVNQTMDEIDKHYDSYLQTIQQYKERVLLYVKKLEDKRLKTLRVYKVLLQKALADIEHSCGFVQRLITEGSDEEILNSYDQVFCRLAQVSSHRSQLPRFLSQPVTFHPEERAGVINGHVMYGTVTTGFTVSASRSSLLTEGIDMVYQNQSTEVRMDIRDHQNQTVAGSEANITSHLICNAHNRYVPVEFLKCKESEDVKLRFTAATPGLHCLTVKIGQRDIKGSPWKFFVHPSHECAPVKVSSSPHSGVFHCCSFCSSAGSKDATCACGGVMPGGYTGCGHGHQGHPGRKHWSCCGSTWEDSECTRHGQVYQVTL